MNREQEIKESIENTNLSEALENIGNIDLGDNPYKTFEHNKLKNVYNKEYTTIKQALLKKEEPKHYLKWDDIEFSYGTKTQKVRMGDTIYKIEYVYYDNVKEVKLLSEDEKCYYIGFTGKYKDNVQLFNNLHLEKVEENSNV